MSIRSENADHFYGTLWGKKKIINYTSLKKKGTEGRFFKKII